LPPEPVSRVFSGQSERKDEAMHVDIVMLQPLVALLFGVLILILPRLLNYLIAIYLILIGLAGLFPHLLNTPIST
jgi:predicted ABC-type exoprotein transport system permease subunit